MTRTVKVDTLSRDLVYHVLRCSLDGFQKSIAQLDDREFQQAYRKAKKTRKLEALVLASDEARGLVVPEEQMQRSISEISTRYGSDQEFLNDLLGNGLDLETLKEALTRELMFDAVMQRVAARSVEVTDLDLRLFYEMNSARFQVAEQREARHILITVNEEYPENTAAQALKRINIIQQKMQGRINRFHRFAQKHSECPTAMDGGKLGMVKRGQLYPSLDRILFNMDEKQISAIVESEMGYHLMLCEKIKQARRSPFKEAEPRIREVVTERVRRNCQKKWLDSLSTNQAIDVM